MRVPFSVPVIRAWSTFSFGFLLRAGIKGRRSEVEPILGRRTLDQPADRFLVRPLFKLLLAAAVAAFLAYLWLGENGAAQHKGSPFQVPSSSQSGSSRTANTWGNPSSLPDHFARHGADFGARDAGEYARMASDLLQKARTDGLPAKVDGAGVLRVFDPRTGAFGAYNRDGTTKTFFKPGSRAYFERQPGQRVDLRPAR